MGYGNTGRRQKMIQAGDAGHDLTVRQEMRLRKAKRKAVDMRANMAHGASKALTRAASIPGLRYLVKGPEDPKGDNG
jgi:hypothetical protein